MSSKGRGIIIRKQGAFTPLEIKISNRASPIRDQRSYEVSKRFLTGFTLVELLVVIAIIALLMSILMPALARVRRQTKTIMDVSNLRQWALCFSMYTTGNKGSFNAGWPSVYLDGALMEWHNSLEPCYGDNVDLACCPLATRPASEGGRIPFAAWGTYTGVWFRVIRHGSYGINGYAHNPPMGMESHNRPVTYFWRTAYVRRTDKIPLFLDTQRFDGWPLQMDVPPEVIDDYFGGTQTDQMRRYTVNRHEGYVNGIFMDFSGRKIGLKELWKLEWHQGYRENDPSPTAWDDPDHWMFGMRDYD